MLEEKWKMGIKEDPKMVKEVGGIVSSVVVTKTEHCGKAVKKDRRDV
jgi:hypothetical protein